MNYASEKYCHNRFWEIIELFMWRVWEKLRKLNHDEVHSSQVSNTGIPDEAVGALTTPPWLSAMIHRKAALIFYQCFALNVVG